MEATIWYNHIACFQKADWNIWKTIGTWLYLLKTENPQDALSMAEVLPSYSSDTSKKCGLLLSMKRVSSFKQ